MNHSQGICSLQRRASLAKSAGHGFLAIRILCVNTLPYCLSVMAHGALSVGSSTDLSITLTLTMKTFAGPARALAQR